MKRKGIKLLSRIIQRVSNASLRYFEPHHGWVGPEHPPQQSQRFRDYREGRSILKKLRTTLKTLEQIRENERARAA